MSRASLCFHCGQPLPQDQSYRRVAIGGVLQPMCCAGCAAVAQAIVDFGQESYYQERSSYAARPDLAALAPPALAACASGDGEGSFAIDGIHCAACTWLIEGRVARLPGVRSANLNLSTEKLHVDWDPAQCSAGTILAAVHAIGYQAYPYDAERHGAQLQRSARRLGQRLFVAGLAMMQVMMYAAPSYMVTDGSLETGMAALLRWASLVLTLPAMLFAAWPFFAGAWRSLRAGSLGMDVPVALGILAALAGSSWATVSGQGEVWFDSVSMFVFLLLGARYLELGARRAATSALERMQHGLPAMATRWPGGEQVPAAQLAVGERILVKLGEAVAADGVLDGEGATLDLSLLTGESRPETRAPGASVPGGAINQGAPFTLRVTRRAADSTLAALVRLADQAGQGKPRLAELADRVARVFVLLLLLLAVGAFAAWQVLEPGRAWQVAIAVLVVSCPCALSLATPSALAAAADSLLAHGVLLMRPAALEAFDKATHVVFDKTGTLTEGRPKLEAVHPVGNLPRQQCLALAAAMESASGHPLARALLDAADGLALPQVRQLHEAAGRGLQVEIDGVRYRLGSLAYVAEIAGTQSAHAGVSVAWLGRQDQMLAAFLFADPLRAEARAVVHGLRAAGKTVLLLSGDDSHLVQSVAHMLGIGEALGRQLPEDKLAYVRALQDKGAVVAMVGDGVNDAAVLAAADVSVAMGQGAALAQAQADAVLFGAGLTPLVTLQTAARATMRVMRQNLVWACAYNLAAIPLAALGWIGPLAAGVGMAASSTLVVLNALRLKTLGRPSAPAPGRL